MRQTDFVILGLLSESPLTGYQIKKLIDVRFKFFWNESYGQLYPALKSLDRRGLIEETEEGMASKRSQKTYRITKEGMSGLQAWLCRPVERETVRLEILLKLYFSNLTDDAVICGHLEAFQETHKRDLVILQTFERELRLIIDEHPNHLQVLQVVDLGLKINEAYLAWSRETIRLLEERGRT